MLSKHVHSRLAKIRATPAGAGLAILALCALASGCASVPPPRDFDLGKARFLPLTTPTVVDVAGLPGGKLGGAAVGAGSGSGYGALAGGLACLSTGPFFPLCLAAVVPTAALVGTASGAVVGAARTETAGAIDVRTKVLADELAATPYHAMLAKELQRQMDTSQQADATPVTVAADASLDFDIGERPWIVEVGVTELGTEGKGRFALRLVTTLRVRRSTGTMLWETEAEVQSETELTTAQWTSNDSAALHGVLDRCIARAAEQLGAALVPASADKRGARPSGKQDSSCRDVPSTWTQASAPP